MGLPVREHAQGRQSSVGVMKLQASFVIWLLLVALASAAHAQSAGVRTVASAAPPALRTGVTSSGLCGLPQTGSPTCPEGFAAATTMGYGTMKLRGRHDRLLGHLGFAYTPLPWLSVSLELAGRIDVHPDDVRGTNITGTGDPWLRGRVGWPLLPELSLGGELGLWLPGNDAPSFKPSATTAEAKGLVSYQVAPRWQLLGSLGMRLDNSGYTAPDLERLRQGDRITLGLSDSHAVLLGIGVAHHVLPELQAFAEVSAQLLVGKDAPGLLEAPLRAALGARYFMQRGFQLEATLMPSLSQRPSIAVDAPLVPIEPRFSALLGLRYQFGGPKPVVAPAAAETPKALPVRDEPPLATVTGVLNDAQGPLPDANVTLRQGLAEQAGITDAEGRYRFFNVIPGKVQLSASTAGFETDSWEVNAVAPLTEVPARVLAPAEAEGTLRCLVRSFDSDPLKAQVVVHDTRRRRVASGATDAQGLLEISLTSGNYLVVIEAAGYKSQRTNVRVATNEVAILNVDMREGK